MSETTKRPWLVAQGTGSYTEIQGDDDGSTRAIVGTTIGPDSEANAELIVRAVNSHDELVKALEELCRCSVAQEASELPDDREFWSAVGQAKAAIAQGKDQ